MLFLWSMLATGPGAGCAAAEDMITLTFNDQRLHVLIDGDDFRLSQAELLHWVETSARVVAEYYGRFPVPEAYLAIRSMPGSGVWGQAFGWYTPTVNIQLGKRTDRKKLEDDWVLVHELIHIAFPSVPDAHHWLEEGLAVYVEAVARAQAGELSPQQVWAGLVRGMPHGLPRAGDKGLDHTRTWGRTYWGGALFCLLADIEIRKLTGGKQTLRDGLRAIVHEGWSIADRKDLLPTLTLADRAVGVPVLRRLYDKMKDKPSPVELDDLWRQLGVAVVGEAVTFDDSAPLASIRHAITARNAR